MATANGWIRVGTIGEIAERGCTVVRGHDRPIAVFYHEGQVFAVDNRCPHMGFPMHRGTVKDGLLTCHWHHARFDLRSGCTFDLFADDLPSFPVEVRGEEVWVSSVPRGGDPVAAARRRLREGLEQNISLISAKALLALLRAGVDYREIVREIARFGARYRDGWASGMTILTAMANLVPRLSEETAYLALYQGARRVAQDCAGQVPRRDRAPLASDELPFSRLLDWMAYWTTVRHRDGAERTLLTAIRAGEPREQLALLLFSAATQRYYADTGHVLDFCNKAFELLDLIGWEEAEAILPTVIGQLVAARGGEELNSWRHPVDLVALVQEAVAALPQAQSEGEGRTWHGERDLAHAILGEDPGAIAAAIVAAVRQGARPEQLTRALAYAAALRIARFGPANEFGDWIVALHTFTYCNALHVAVRRCPHPLLLRGVLHGAMSVYLDRFLNVPPAPLPGERDSLDDLPTDGETLRAEFLRALDSQQQVDRAARLVARYLDLGHDPQPLIDTLTYAVVREDADFHTFQMVEAAARQFDEWGPSPEGRDLLVAAARYLAAHSPTQRAQLQTARIALRLHRGEAIYEEVSA